jgi:Flp pilus assembly protein TadG
MRLGKGSCSSNRSLRSDTSSTAALEFALILPVLVGLFFGMYDIAEGMISYGEVFDATRTIAASITNVAAQGPNSTTLLYYGQVQQQASAIFAIMPSLRSGFQAGLKSITISSVNFEEASQAQTCNQSAACSYNAFVVWSVAYQGPGSGSNAILTPNLRNCAQTKTTSGTTTLNSSTALTQVVPSTYNPNNLAQLRTLNITSPSPGPVQPDPILVVDIHYTYTPLFPFFVKKAIDFYTNAYFPLRSVQATVLVGSSFNLVEVDTQFTGLVAYNTNNSMSPPYKYQINSADVNEIAATSAGSAPPAADYCISPWYLEPTSCTLASSNCTAS